MISKLKLKKQVLEGIEKNIKEREKWLASTIALKDKVNIINILPKMPEDAARVWIDSSSINFKFRYDKLLKTTIKKLMLNNGFEVTHEGKEEDIVDNWSDPYIWFRRNSKRSIYRNFNVCFSFDDTVANSTCTRKVIGKETKEVDVYEWNCEEE